MKKLLALGLSLLMVFSLLAIGVSADPEPEPAAGALPTEIRGQTKFATKTAISFDEENVLQNYVSESSAGRCTYELADGAIGKGLKLTSGSDTCELYITLPWDEGATSQNWSYYDGIMWYVDNTGLTLNTDQTLSGTAVRVYPKTSNAWTRNKAGSTEPVLSDFAIDAYYLKDGVWTLCDQTKMNGERLMLPANFAGWIYVPFSSYLTVKGIDDQPTKGIVGSEIVTRLMLLTGPYTTSPAGCSSLIFDEITLVKFGMTNEELAAYIEEHKPDPGEVIVPGQYAMPTSIQGFANYATKSVMSFDEEGVASRITPSSADRCTFAIEDAANGKGLKLTSKQSTGEVKIKLFPDEGNEDSAQDWSPYEGIMWWLDTTGVAMSPGKDYTGSAIRVYTAYGGGYSWTRNKAGDSEPVLSDYVINAYYYYNGEWILCDRSSMDGERVVVPQNFAGWIYVPFSSYLTTKGSIGEPETGIYGNFAVSQITILTGPYTILPQGCSSVVIDEIMLVKPGMTNEELAEQLAQQQQGEDTTTGQTPVTRAPAATTASPSTDTTAPAATSETPKKTKKSGCGSSIALSSAVVVITVIGGAGLLCRKRKENE